MNLRPVSSLWNFKLAKCSTLSTSVWAGEASWNSWDSKGLSSYHRALGGLFCDSALSNQTPLWSSCDLRIRTFAVWVKRNLLGRSSTLTCGSVPSLLPADKHHNNSSVWDYFAPSQFWALLGITDAFGALSNYFRRWRWRVEGQGDDWILGEDEVSTSV